MILPNCCLDLSVAELIISAHVRRAKTMYTSDLPTHDTEREAGPSEDIHHGSFSSISESQRVWPGLEMILFWKCNMTYTGLCCHISHLNTRSYGV